MCQSRVRPHGEEWVAKHDVAFAHAKVPVPTASTLTKFEASFPSQWQADLFAELPLREQEVVYYLSTVHSTSIAGDISQCISRQAASTDMMLPCFTGSSKVWLISEMREFCGREKLALQG